ncbi:hypothetical protein NQ318_017158, partial [Aromia moschata]
MVHAVVVIHTIFGILIRGVLTDSCSKAPSNCPNTHYRSHDGSCNNLKHPSWGMSNTTYGRLLPPKYGDGIGALPRAKSGKPLPLPRKLSSELYPERNITDSSFTLNAQQYGQIITHDMSFTQMQSPETPCCTQQGKNLDPLTRITHYLDLSLVYGNNDVINSRLREYKGGRLLVDKIGGKEWPHLLRNNTLACEPTNVPRLCDYASDPRINQNTELTVLQVLLLRKHNVIAANLAAVNPHWNDEKLYQEARRINIAAHQYVSYYEWLPIILGKEYMLQNRIIYETDECVDDYNEEVNPSVLNEHATAAFRYYHTQIAGILDVVNEPRKVTKTLRLSDWYRDPGVLYDGDNFEGLCRGLATQLQMADDSYHDHEVTLYMFRNGSEFGQDLKSADILRCRNHGLASYNDVREYCNLRRAKNFDELTDINETNRQKLKKLYESVDDIDLTVGGSLEELIPGTQAGPTFHCIMLKQFLITRIGDRFWFERCGETGFTKAQLKEIRKTSITGLMCLPEGITHMQKKGFLKISKK